MAWAINHPRRVQFRHSAGTREVLAEPRVITRPLGASLAGTAALLVGIWAAIAGYVGPYFGFYPTSGQVWDWNLRNGLLHLAPGALAVLAALMLLAASPARRGVRVGALGLPAVLMVIAGAWLVIGPAAWPMFESTSAFTPAIDAGRNLLNQAGASLAPGLALATFGGMAFKAAIARPVAESVAPAAAPVAEAAPATERAVPVEDTRA